MSEKRGLSNVNQEKSGQSYNLLKKGGYSYTWQRWKRRPFGTHIFTMPYVESYPSRPPLHPPPPPPPPTSPYIIIINSKEYAKEEPQSQNTVYQWHQEED